VARRVRFIHSHEAGLGYLGPFTALREESDGLWGDAEVLRSRAGDVEDLLAAGVRELSVEFHLTGPQSTQVDEDGTRWRTRAHLVAVALEPKGAYTGAEVMAFRAEVDAAEAEQAKERAQQISAEEAEVQRQAAVAEAARQAEAQRRASWEALTARYDTEAKRQEQMVKDYGLTIPTARFYS
jgi:hypothetical protein